MFICTTISIFFLVLLSYEKPPSSVYFSDDEVGMTCTCPAQCQLIDYATEISSVQKTYVNNKHFKAISLINALKIKLIE